MHAMSQTVSPASPHVHPEARRPGKREWIGGLILVLAVIVSYLPARHAGFIWDDDAYVTENKLLFAPDGLRRIWFSFESLSQYFPMAYTVLRLEYALWGLEPAGYHWSNILLHAINAVLVWRLLRRLDLPGAWLGAAIWALHPVQVESVAWVTEIKNLLMGLFFVLALRAWIGFVEEKSGRKWIFYGLMLVAYALALFSKTTACTLPAALLLILWLKDRRITWLRLIQILPVVALGLGMGMLSIWCEQYHPGVQGKLFAEGKLLAMSPLDRILLASRAFWFYLSKLFWPTNLAFSYPRWTITASDPWAYAWLVAMAGLGVFIYGTRRYFGRSVEVAVVFFIATLSPLLGFLRVYTFLWSFVADHYQYIASLGVIALAASGTAAAFGAVQRRAAFFRPVLCGALLMSLGVLTWRQCGMYIDMETLWRTTILRNPDSFLAHNNLGTLLLQRGREEEAIVHFEKALEFEPDSTNARNNLGTALLQMGRAAEAVPHFLQALQIEPDNADAHNTLGCALLQMGSVNEAITHYEKALQIAPGNADAYYNFGTALVQKGRADEAIPRFQKALEIRPDYAEAYYYLGNILLQKGKMDEAIADYQKALQIKPGFMEAHNNLGTVLLQKGDADQAVVHFQKILQAKPDDADANNNLAWVLATSPKASLRNGGKAVELAQRANQLTGGENPNILGTLAAAYAEAGRFSDAMTSVQKAVRLAQATGQLQLIEQLDSGLKLYEAGSPFRETGP